MPQIESYDEFKDPLDHLETFKTLIHLQGVPDEIMCRAFPTTLKGAVRIWFSRLTPNSINTFKELSTQFTSHFIGGHRYKKSTACLISIKQREYETLRSYITRFNKEALLLMRPTTRFWWRLSPMVYGRENSCSLYIKTTQRPCLRSSIGPQNT